MFTTFVKNINVVLKDKVVIITGASSGIGKALAYAFADKGCCLSLAARNQSKLEEIKNDLTAKGIKVITTVADVSKEEDCKSIIDRTVEAFGRIDILINNAGISMRAAFEEVDLSVLHKLMDVNFWGTVYCTKYSIQYLLQSKGSLVGISSIAGYKGLPARTGYSASKFAMQGFLETLRIEYLKRDLHVLIACPGFTASNIRMTALDKQGNPQGETPRDESKMMTAEEVARKIVKAIEKKKHRLVLTTTGKLTVLLNKFFPKWVDRMVFNHIAKEPDSPFVKEK